VGRVFLLDELDQDLLDFLVGLGDKVSEALFILESFLFEEGISYNLNESKKVSPCEKGNI
jgi:hypothetical protein